MLLGGLPWEKWEPDTVLFKHGTGQPSYALPSTTTAETVAFLEWLFTRDPRNRPYAKQALEHKFMQSVNADDSSSIDAEKNEHESDRQTIGCNIS